jgi:uncharacterized protein YidB (DUF937 family)
MPFDGRDSGLGSVLGGASAGSVLSGGLANIIEELQDSGHGRVAQSWGDTLNTLSKQTGMSMNDLLAGLSQHLPDLIDQLTPNGRLPTEQEAARMV